jgi:hypothetical protein
MTRTQCARHGLAAAACEWFWLSWSWWLSTSFEYSGGAKNSSSSNARTSHARARIHERIVTAGCVLVKHFLKELCIQRKEC